MASSSVFSSGSAHDPTERAGELAARRIWKLLEEGRTRTGFSRSAFFTQVLRVWDALLRPMDLDEYLNTLCVGIENAMPQIIQAFHELQQEAIAHYLDVLGIVYMLAGVRANAGEEYTPWSLVRLLVRLHMVDFTPPAPGDPPRTFYDPCCGSGTLLLGYMEYLDLFYPAVLDRDQARFFGQEARFDAWLMARMNLQIHALGRHLRRSKETLSSKIQRSPDEGLEQLAAVKDAPSALTDSPPSPTHPAASSYLQQTKPEPPDGLDPLFPHSPIPTRQRKRKHIVQLPLPGFSSSEKRNSS